MPGPIDLIIWFLGTAFELLFVVCSLARKSFLRYLFPESLPASFQPL